jgi:hypothetical protein
MKCKLQTDDDPQIMAVTKLIVDMLFYYKRDINELEEFLFLT